MKIKYPRTPHFIWSPGAQNDDRILHSTRSFEGKEVVVSIKMDGENTTLYSNDLHARSLDSPYHASRAWVKSFHATIMNDIPNGWRFCGENMYAKHSIAYKNIEDYFLLFSIWDDKNICLSWDETCAYAQMIGIKTVPVIYNGIWDEEKIKGLYEPFFNGDPCEGYVVRLREAFHYDFFGESVAKYVRKGHIQTEVHWRSVPIIPNVLKGS